MSGMTKTVWIHDDGGRAKAGFKGTTGDCAVRAISIATGRLYADVYAEMFDRNRDFAETRAGARKMKGRTSPRDGVFVEVMKKYMADAGWLWVPTMSIGSGCRVHLLPDELPEGRIITRLSRHYCAVVDGVAHDIYDPTREGTRCVYGYWEAGAPADW